MFLLFCFCVKLLVFVVVSLLFVVIVGFCVVGFDCVLCVCVWFTILFV